MAISTYLSKESLQQFDRSSSSSMSTGSFSSERSSSSSSSSSTQSFSSRSTIVAAKPQPFGLPEYNYFWIENESKSNSKLSFYFNNKSNCVVWQRPCPKDIPLPYYKSTWGCREPNLSEDDDVLVSEPEDEFQRRKRVNIRRRNKRLAEEERIDGIEVVRVKKVLKSKRILDTFWKLYRFPGESLADVKKRLLDSSSCPINVKSEIISSVDNYIDRPIKQEHCFNNENNFINSGEFNQTIKTLNEDSDSDPENVSYLIKQEYLMNYNVEDSEEEYARRKAEYEEETPEALKKDSDIESIEDSEDSMEAELEENSLINSNNMLNTYEECNMLNSYEQEELDNFEYVYEAPNVCADLLEIEIQEYDEQNIFESLIEHEEDCLIENDINWEFEQSSKNPVNAAFTKSVLDSVYGAPKLKAISAKHIGIKRKRTLRRRKRAPKKIIKTEPQEDIKPQILGDSNDQVIICDMYGTRTVNYNHPPKMKVPKWQDTSKLSDSEDSDFVPPTQQIKQERLSPDVNGPLKVVKPVLKREKNDNNPLKLTSWFPKRKNQKRKIYTGNSDESWHGSNLSDWNASDLEEFDLRSIKIKKERLSPVPVTNKTSYSHSCDNSLPIAVDSIKKEKEEPRSRLPSWEIEESEMPESMTPALPLVDPKELKVESSCLADFETNPLAVNVVIEPEHKDDSDSDSSSSSSSCSCSRSSCCSSSSSSSSSSNSGDGNGGGGGGSDDKEVKKGDL